MTASEPLHLFSAYGVELEYMIVECASLNVAPVADRLLERQAGEICNDVEIGPLCWSNELALHVIEQKTNGPATTLAGLGETFHNGIRHINEHLQTMDCCLMPGAMHPWMNPATDTRLWPHGDSSIYNAYDKIFSCRGHGWSNLQSTHINLPFCGDEEFGRLHAAVRLVLPLLPALAASSPIVDEKFSGLLDTRLDTYRRNQRRIPQITAAVIPEQAFSQADYQREILEPMYAALRPWPEGSLLSYEWLNSRGAIARFDRGSIEIRLLDLQECPQSDLAIVELVCAVIQALTEERWCSLAEQQSWWVTPLSAWLSAAIRDAEQTLIEDPAYLALFGLQGAKATMAELWRSLAERLLPERLTAADSPLAIILSQGPLARRILKASGLTPGHRQLHEIYRQLCSCLAAGIPYVP